MQPLYKDDETGYYLPHHAVCKQESVTTKLRVVFDGSAKTASGVSLNDTLMKGPTIQRELFEIIVCFRFHNVAITADVEKMYRQVQVHPCDRKYQKIIWRDHPQGQIQIFSLSTVTYGTTTAPFLAVRCLHQLGADYQKQLPQAAEVIRDDFYVDDLLTGACNEEEGRKLYEEITQILKAGCFELRKWRSNHQDMFPPSEIKNYKMPHDKLESAKTLGLIWNSSDDVFKFSINSVDDSKHTKRNVLSAIAQIFDPLGFLGPVITLAKLIMQKLWQLHLDWDDVLPEPEHAHWKELQKQLLAINNLSIPRKVIKCEDFVELQLHGFCDASQRAFGACVYLKTTDKFGNNSVQILCSKGRVAPLKIISLPRLELCAALLLSQLVAKLKRCLTVSVRQYHLWTDSSIVLCWLAAPPATWKTFISNRVAEIQHNTNVNEWHHVRSAENPADAISRGLLPERLIKNELWWTGPSWLSSESHNWPISQISQENNDQNILEKRQEKTICSTVKTIPHTIFDRYPSITKLTRIVAYCLRFKFNCLNERKQLGNLTAQEIQNALKALLRTVQEHEFSEEIKSLRQHGTVKTQSKLIKLGSFLDEDDLIRVGGRIIKANIPFTQKHPIVLPSSHPFTNMLIHNEHLQLLHAGPQAVLTSLRTKYWPLSGRNAVRKITHKCLTCFKHKPTVINPYMGNLPSHRVNQFRPFLNVGIDYAGPVTVKERIRRGRVNTYHCYIVVFICLSTRAVHLELVSSLTTEAFLATLKRFTARRGKVANIYSDNATTFVKANKDLKELTTLWKSTTHWNQIETFAANNHIHWHFIPPRSPTFGGLWEAAVKSLKHHIRRITGNAIFTYEEYNTFLIQTEACLNSRPLTPLSNDPNDLSVLTPSHFLIGDSLQALPEPDHTITPVNHLTRWNHIQQLVQHLWKRWSSEYLNYLQVRSKWCQRSSNQNIRIGSLVLLKEENLPPLHWKIGRIIEVFPGGDGVVRVALVKTASGNFKRAINKLCFLPLDTD